MRFEAEHWLQGTPTEVAELLADPAFYLALGLPDVSLPEVLDERTEGTARTLSMRYEFEGNLDPVARRLLGQRRLAWIQDVRVDRNSARGELSFRAEADPRRLHGSAEFALTAQGNGTTRRLAGELVVSVPMIGPWAERQIMPGLLRRLDIEARGLDEALRGD